MSQSSSRPPRAKNCAECRRLKIRCDRNIPCSNCFKQGKTSICPDLTVLSKGHRVILSATDDLPAKIEELTNKIKKLEDALAESHARHHNDAHPEETRETNASLQGFGVLMMGEGGHSRFFGATSSVEWTMATDGPSFNASGQDAQFSVQPEPGTLPFSTLNPGLGDMPLLPLLPLPSQIPETLLWKERLSKSLPDREVAYSLVGAYYGRAAWDCCSVPRITFINEFFGPCYDHLENPPITMYDLGFIYSVFAIGALHSPEMQSNDALAGQYVALSQACLEAGDPLSNTNVTVVDTLLLHIRYYTMCDDYSGHPAPTGLWSNSAARAWTTLGVTMKLAIAIGLHREPSLWGLPPNEVTRRRRTMWELINLDLWIALISGRPPTLARQHCDVQLPLASPDISEADPNFNTGKYHFIDNCLWEIVNLGLASSRRTSYDSVLQLDNKIRSWELPQSLVIKGSEPTEEQRTAITFRKTMERVFKEIALICLHRCYLASALLSPSFDLGSSLYSESVLSAYASSCTILSQVQALYAAEPVTIMRFPFFWTHAFSAAIMIGAIVMMAPDCSLAATALSQLDLAVEMFKAAQAGYRAGRGLPTLLHLHTEAHASMNKFYKGSWNRNATPDSSLLRNLGGSRVVLHHQHPPVPVFFPPNTSTSTSTGYNSSFDGYNPTTGLGGGMSGMDGQMPGPTEELLHGVLTGDWAGVFLPGLDGGGTGTNESMDTYTPVSLPPEGYSPYSDADSSSEGGVVVGMGVEHSPLLSFSRPATLGMMLESHIEEHPQRSFVWENFLNQLGIQGTL